MTTLYLIGALMALAAALFAAVPLLRAARASSAPAQDAANVAVYTDQLADLDRDLKNGLLTQEQYDHAKPELERRLLQDVVASATPTATPGSADAPRWLGFALAVLVPTAAVGMYFWLGTPDAIDAASAPPQTAASDQEQEIEAVLPQLMQRLQEHPDDLDSWKMMGRAMVALQRYPEAAKAYQKIAELAPDSAQAQADYAETLGMAQGQRLEGAPAQALERALKIDPKNPKALYLSGIAAVEAGDAKRAVGYWEKLLPLLPPEQKGAAMLRQKIAELRQNAGMGPGTVAPAAGGESATASAADAHVSGHVQLSAALKGAADPQDTVFVFARAVSGPRMPLALKRVQVKDLPMDFNLDDSMAMSPQMKLSNFPEVVIVARVSKAGSAISQPGDLEGSSEPVKLGARNVPVEISRKIE